MDRLKLAATFLTGIAIGLAAPIVTTPAWQREEAEQVSRLATAPDQVSIEAAKFLVAAVKLQQQGVKTWPTADRSK